MSQGMQIDVRTISSVVGAPASLGAGRPAIPSGAGRH